MPPQYTVEVNERQTIGAPFIYVFMHNDLAVLDLLLVTMMGGFARGFQLVAPGFRNKFFSTTPSSSIHKWIRFWMLFLIACGAIAWMLVMYPDCKNDVKNACSAFGFGVANFKNSKRIYEVALDPVAISLHNSSSSLLGVFSSARTACESFQIHVVVVVEILLYVQILAAVMTLILALLCRFEIFWPLLISLGLHFIHHERETFWPIKEITLDQVEIFRPHLNTGPSSMHLKLKLHQGKHLLCEAGQWVYILIPEIDCNWHPFNLSCETTRNFVELLIGIRNKEWRLGAEPERPLQIRSER